QSYAWESLLCEKGPIPFILYPNLCAKCGALWPEMFSVPDEEWERYVEPEMRREMLCEACYRQIKAWIDDAFDALVVGPSWRRWRASLSISPCCPLAATPETFNVRSA